MQLAGSVAAACATFAGLMSNPSDTGGFGKLRHDLRTCVNQIIGYSELLQEEAEEVQPDFIPDLQKIQQAGRRLLGLLDGLFADAPGGAVSRESSRSALAPKDATESDETADDDKGVILVVDDNEMNRDMLSRRLLRQGFEVDLADDGREALKKIENRDYDLVLLDVMMPEISGIDVLRQVRKSRTPSDLPIIMVTAQGESEDIVVAFDLGANDYVTKPIDFPVALARCRTQLAMRSAVIENRRLAREVEIRTRFIRQTFGRYLTEEVVSTLLEDRTGLDLGGEKRRVTIMMSDLRGFSAISERLPAQKVVAILNNYLEIMTTVILEHGGTIDEFIGDAILVIFGAPVARDDHARAAVRCAVAMQQAMDAVNRRNHDQGFPELEMGVGINTGDVVVGNIGSEKRAKYGVVGSHVNLASRVESYTVGGQILVTESTLREAGTEVIVAGSIEVRPKGYDEPIEIHDVRGVGSSSIDESDDSLVDLGGGVDVAFVQVRGKDTAGDIVSGKLLGVSRKRGRLRSIKPLDVMADLKVILDISDQTGQCHAYAKVMNRSGDDNTMYEIRFTSLSPEGESRIAVLVGTMPPREDCTNGEDSSG